LVIGVSEASGQGIEFGVGNLVDQISSETLTWIGIDGRAQPRLARSWAWERDEQQLRLRLRDDVLLHDGRRFDSQIAAEALAIAVARRANRAQYPALTDVTAAVPDGQFELVLELSRRSSLLPEDLNVVLDIRAGPDRPVDRTTDTIELERFDSYYLGPPSITHVTLRSFDTLRTTWANLLRGELDMVYDVPADAIEFISNDDVQVFAVPRWYQLLITFNMRREPFQSPLVRRALNLAINRQSVIEHVLKGRGTPSTGPVWPRYWAHDDSVASFVFDPGEAESLLAAAGFPLRKSSDPATPPARFRFTCLIPQNFSVWERIALEVQRDLFNVGVDMQFKVVPFGEFNALIANGQFDAALVDLISGPTPERPFIFWRSARAFQGAYNVFGYENRDAEGAFDILRTSTNEAAVRSATRRLQHVMVDDPPALFLAWTERARAVRRDILVPKTDASDLMWTLSSWSRRAPGAASAE
jgi:ABC-type transport system substrate-binding protein